MESSLYRQFEKYDNKCIKKELSKSDNWIKEVFKKAWGKNGIECNVLTSVEEKLLNEAIKQFEINLKKFESEVSKETLENLPQNFYEYFDKDDMSMVLEIINESKNRHQKYYNLLVKIYGEQYDTLKSEAIISKNEFSIFENYVIYIQEQVQIRKRSLIIKENLKSNFLEYFEEDDRLLVIEILEEYKLENKNYFLTLIKLYGENYDELRDILVNSRDNLVIEKLKLKVEKDLVKLKIDKKVRSEIKDNFLEYFNDYNIILVKKIIDNYKNTSTFRYNTIVRLYGNEYNKLNKEIILTEKEFYIITTTVIQITKRLTNFNNRVVENNNYTKIKTAEIEFNIKFLTEYFKTTEDVIDESVSQLPSIERKCIKFYYGIGTKKFSVKDVAKILKISEEEVKENIERAIIIMGNSIRIIKNKNNAQVSISKVKVRPKAYKRQ